MWMGNFGSCLWSPASSTRWRRRNEPSVSGRRAVERTGAVKLDILYLGGEEEEQVGRLYERSDGRVFFEYSPVWAAGGRELSPVYLPNTTRGSVATPTPPFGSLHGLFSDSLPDWWGEQLMRRYF